MHIWEDHFIAEIVDPDTFEVLPEGSEGELVITTITKEEFALRYRTKDISTLMTGPCPCGRTHARIARVRRERMIC
jgi:phenylacetate-CoA ligase